jgi:phenylacetate-CoA ligase
MNLYHSLASHVILPASDLFTGWDVKKAMVLLDDSQWWSEDQMIDYQNKSIQRLIKHSYTNVPYYKDLFDKYDINPNSIKEKADLKRIPVLTKEIIINNFHSGKLFAQNWKKSNVRLESSSGSTGAKTIFYINNNAYGFNIGANLRGWSWMGYTIGDSIVKITQNRRNSYIKKLQDFINRTALYTGSYTQESYEEFKKLLNSNKEFFLRSYPDPLIYFASKLKSESETFKSVVGINTTGNILFPESRELIENAFNTKVFDSYSCEGGANVFECETHENYHVSDEYGVVEIEDDQKKEVSDLEFGKAIVTDFFNFASPFIRYESKDILQKGSKCSCGRCLSTVKKIGGRDNDVVITPQGQMLIAQSFTTYFKYIKGVEQFQVIQNEANSLIFNLRTNSRFDKSDEFSIKKYWQDKTSNEMNISIIYVPVIEPLISGKIRFVIRDKKIPITF